MPTLESLLDNFATSRAAYKALVDRAEKLIAEAEDTLGYRLSDGERSDLLLDNFSELQGTKESHAIVRTLHARLYEKYDAQRRRA